METVESYLIETLSSPASKQWLDTLIKQLQCIANKQEALTRDELRLLQAVFNLIPRGTGERDRLEYMLDRLAAK